MLKSILADCRDPWKFRKRMKTGSTYEFYNNKKKIINNTFSSLWFLSYAKSLAASVSFLCLRSLYPKKAGHEFNVY